MDLLKEINNPEPVELKSLSYKEDSLSPTLSKKAVDLHYNTLTKNYFKKYEETKDEFQKAGAILHNLWWENLKPSKEVQDPTEGDDKISKLIQREWSNFSDFQREFAEKATTIQGNGWCILTKEGIIKQVQNHKIIPNVALIVDMWEHSYYLDYGPDKDKYIESLWNIVNWDVVNNRL